MGPVRTNTSYNPGYSIYCTRWEMLKHAGLRTGRYFVRGGGLSSIICTLHQMLTRVKGSKKTRWQAMYYIRAKEETA